MEEKFNIILKRWTFENYLPRQIFMNFINSSTLCEQVELMSVTDQGSRKALVRRTRAVPAIRKYYKIHVLQSRNGEISMSVSVNNICQIHYDFLPKNGNL